MLRYVISRLGWTIFDLLVILTITFILSYLLPGDPARTIAGPHASIETIIRIRSQLGLDKPLYVQYGQVPGQHHSPQSGDVDRIRHAGAAGNLGEVSGHP